MPFSKQQTLDGLPIYNAEKSQVIHISKADVRLGAKKSPERCAAALSAKRLFHADKVQVHLGRTYVKVGKKWTRYLTPQALRAEIIAFDRGGSFQPGDYTLGKMTPSKANGIHQGGGNRRKKPIKRRGPYHVFHGVRRKASREFERGIR